MHPGAQAKEGTVEVWRVDLDPDDALAANLAADLSADERARLQRLARPQVARRWLAGRAALRGILASQLGVAPAAVRLTTSEHGRPALDPETHPAPLDFNLSHSAGLGLVAASAGLRVGVDVECLRRGRDPMPVAERYFSPAEVAALHALRTADRQAAFFRYWTAKEALAKGLGLGLKAPLRELELVRQPDGTMEPVRLGRGWQLISLNGLPDGYGATLAVNDPPARVSIRDWRPRD